MNSLEQLKKMTKVVADTGDFETIKQFQPIDSTTNPSLILASAQDPKYEYLLNDAIAYAKSQSQDNKERLNYCLDKLAVNFGLEILKVVPGRVSTEVDARLSFDTLATIERAKFLIALYESAGINRERILIKIAATWEGIKAAQILEQEGIKTNLTLLFCKAQAIACANVCVTLISPFVGRILDWYKKNQSVDYFKPAEDPGVISVTEIFNYYKKFDYKTEIMGASFRNVEEVRELAGCDLLTISPKLLAELESSEETVERKLNSSSARSQNIEKIELNEAEFCWALNENAMATEKLAEGIRNFSADLVKLENFISEKM